MDSIAATLNAEAGAVSLTSTGLANPSEGFSDLQTQDFLKLLITQLTQQDPLEPTDNAALLEQLSSIRTIELSSSLTESLRALTGQQNFASASSLMGQYVKGVADESGVAQEGVVQAIQLGRDGKPVLQLSNGGLLPLDQVQIIEPPLRVAERLTGMTVIGVDRESGHEGEAIEGLVTSVRLDDKNNVVLELDSGKAIRLQDLVGVSEAVA